MNIFDINPGCAGGSKRLAARPQRVKRRVYLLTHSLTPPEPADRLSPRGPYGEVLNDARKKTGSRRVSARRGWEGEKAAFFNLLLGLAGHVSYLQPQSTQQEFGTREIDRIDHHLGTPARNTWIQTTDVFMVHDIRNPVTVQQTFYDGQFSQIMRLRQTNQRHSLHSTILNTLHSKSL